jgi:aminoglycoside phosphotransferase (APT) family kinase protein
MLGAVQADIEADSDLVRHLLSEQHPDLGGPLSLVASGWDNAIYRLGSTLSVRLPRRRIAADLLRNEQRWLPVLAGSLPVPIPAPVRVGVATPAFPWPWSVNEWLPGSAVADMPVAPRAAFAEQFAAFMTALHVPAPADAPANPVRGVPLRTRGRAMEERFATGLVPSDLRGLWDELVAVPEWSGPPLWVHGDMHPGNLLAAWDGHASERATGGGDRLVLGGGNALRPGGGDGTGSRGGAATGLGGRLTAVIDFGDLTSGDPASDLAAAWLVFDAPGRALFRSALADVDDATWQRARGWALNIAAAMAVDTTGTPQMAAVAEHALREVR